MKIQEAEDKDKHEEDEMPCFITDHPAADQ